MKIRKYQINNGELTLYYTNTTFEVNLLTNNNLVNGLGAIVCGRITSSLVLLDSLLRENNIIDQNDTLELEIVNDFNGFKTIAKVNSYGEMFYNSDTLHASYSNQKNSTIMDVSSFMCPNDSTLLIQLLARNKQKVINLCQKHSNKFYWTSKSGNISDEFSTILTNLGVKRTALSVGVEYVFNEFYTKGSGALLVIANVDNEDKLNQYAKYIKSLPQIKDIIEQSKSIEQQEEKIIFKNYEPNRLDVKYYSYNFKAFEQNYYQKEKLINSFKILNITPNYAQLANVLYSSNEQKLVESCKQAKSAIYKPQNINIPVIGIFEQNEYIHSLLLDLKLEISPKLQINNPYDDEFAQAINNVLTLFDNKINVSIGFENQKIKLSGSSLSLTLYYAIKTLLKKRPIRNDLIFSANLDSLGNVKFISSLIFKIRCAIKYGYKYFICSIENKKEVEAKLFGIEKTQINIIYINHIEEINNI